MVKIGTVLSSKSHLEYIVQLYTPPENFGLSPSDYAVGSFVKLGNAMVGLIVTTEVSNPNNLVFSPQKEDLTRFAPDLLQEVSVLIRIALLGEQADSADEPKLKSPSLVAVGTEVMTLTDDELLSFHCNSKGGLNMAYLSRLRLIYQDSLAELISMIGLRIKPLLDSSQVRVFSVLERNLSWTRLNV